MNDVLARAIAVRDELTADVVLQTMRKRLTYDPQTGHFTHNFPSGGSPAGAKAGWIAGPGYVLIRINKKTYCAHRLAWLYMTGRWPVGHIDHIDGNQVNNRFANLRDVTRSGNQQNQRRAHADAKTGFLGVHFRDGKYEAAITINKVRHRLGRFADPAVAHEAYLEAKRHLHPHGTL